MAHTLGLEAKYPSALELRDMRQGMLLALEKIGACVGNDVQIVTHSNRGSTVLTGTRTFAYTPGVRSG
ncbi:MAG TPA: hypothetical protein VF681_05640 [Abditibacteriaceae bacterium]